MIKVTTSEKGKYKEVGFPKLMVRRDGEVVLVTSANHINATGFSLFDPTGFRVCGFYSEVWDMRMFSDYTGEITLKN